VQGLTHAQLLSTILFPYDHANMMPAISPSSKYILRLHFNGCCRKVVVDDLLPSSTDSRIFHVVDRCNPGYLWPALVEKAYLKVRGGYDFPGSNSGTDLAVLTGWLPEQVFLHDEDVMPEELWSRFFKAFTYGDVLITIGTGKLSRREQRQLGLAAEHDYAILDMKETDGDREMLIKNPWSDGDVWKGSSLRGAAAVGEHEQTLSASFEQLSTKDEDEMLAPGTFWMDLGSVFQHFENLYLSWNPGLFSDRQDYHFCWDLGKQQAVHGSFEANPQFSVKCSESGSLWLLLNRHFKTGDYQGKERAPYGFISLYLFNRVGHRVLVSDGAMMRGPYVDSPNTLIKLDAKANAVYTVVVASQDLPNTKLCFTLSAFSRCSTELALAEKQYLSVVSKTAAWTRSTAGGNSESSLYLTNPQFALTLLFKAKIAIMLASNRPETDAKVAVHMKVLFTDGTRVKALRTRDIVAHSGDYRRGSAVLETALDLGTYTIICSTFETGQQGKFTISVHSSSATSVILQPLPAEGSGRLITTSAPAVFSAGTIRLLAPLSASRLTRASLVVQPAQTLVLGSSTSSIIPRAHSLLKLTLEQGQGPYKTSLATSSASDEREYHDPTTGGVRIDDFDIRPEMQRPEAGGLWLVLHRMAGSTTAMQVEEGFRVLILAEERVEIGVWGVGDG
jgi:calpain-7